MCSGYKHATLRDENTSLPLSVRGAYKATTAPYQTIWCFRTSPGGSDSPGYLSPDHPHPGSATYVISHIFRAFNNILINAIKMYKISF